MRGQIAVVYKIVKRIMTNKEDETKSIGGCDRPIKWGSETITLFVASVPIGEADANRYVLFNLVKNTKH